MYIPSLYVPNKNGVTRVYAAGTKSHKNIETLDIRNRKCDHAVNNEWIANFCNRTVTKKIQKSVTDREYYRELFSV